MEITLKITLDHANGPEIDDPANVADVLIELLQGEELDPVDEEGHESTYKVTGVEVVA